MITHRIFSFIGLLFFCGSITAHDRYLLPSHTVLSGDATSVSMTASISNDVFHPDMPLGDDGSGKVSSSLRNLFKTLKPQAILPDGTLADGEPWRAFGRFSAGQQSLEKAGTYRVSLFQDTTDMVTFKKADGSGGRIFGADAKVPEGATGIRRFTTASRTESFVTLDKPTRAAWEPTGKGLELSGESHPNDLFINEKAQFSLFLDGKPAPAGTEVTLVREDTRHRNQRDPITKKVDADGSFDVTFGTPGFYLLKASAARPGAEGSGIERHFLSLYVTLEVFPE